MESKDPTVREGFQVLQDRYSTPADSAQLAADIHEIARTLDETYKRAVNILIEQGIIHEPRSLCREEHHQKLSLFNSRLKNSGCHD